MANNSSHSNSDMPFSVDLDNYDDDDAVAFGTVIHKIGKVKTVMKSMSQYGGTLDSFLYNEFKNSLGTSNYWTDQGTNSEILKIGSKGWKKGKVKLKIVMEFYPDEPEIKEVNQGELSLDDIRRTMNN